MTIRKTTNKREMNTKREKERSIKEINKQTKTTEQNKPCKQKNNNNRRTNKPTQQTKAKQTLISKQN